MAKIGNLFFIKVSPLFIGSAIIVFVLLAMALYMKKRNVKNS